ncbi:GNAT family N-acetyltransferase [Thiothrix sp.]|uniref:GNAT family N-acetyltransferase n=1 Tax=Thiothrix sp. TaxID=1032 RepID=UPI002639A97B|nr:GNAT family N-acetyltransferase [Thiothrix sp.]
MIFEGVYEPDLRSDLKDKAEMLREGDTSWLFVNGNLAGEAQSIEVKKLCDMEEDEMADIDDPRYLTEKTSYLYSFTTLPAYQGKGLGKLLFAYHLGYLTSKGYPLVVSHCTAPGMEALCHDFGALFTEDGVHKNWYGTKRTARFCEIRMFNTLRYKQTTDYNCGVFALLYLIENLSPVFTEKYISAYLKPAQRDGTGCESIVYFMRRNRISFAFGNHQKLTNHRPMLVRYMDDKDEHYSVIIHSTRRTVSMLDPWVGKAVTVRRKDFEKNWHSKRYGKRWGLYLL